MAAKFGPVDISLMATARKMLDDVASSKSDVSDYAAKATLLWAGAHYLLVRTGLYQGKREVFLLSRETLLLVRGNKGENAMLAVALATIDPILKNWNDHFKRRLWCSGHFPKEVLPETRHLNGTRWSKALRAELTTFAEQQDATFDERLQAEADVRRLATEFAERVAAGVKAQGLPLSDEFDPLRPSRMLGVRIEGANHASEIFLFAPVKLDVIRVIWQRVHFNLEEFEILTKAVREINALRQSRSPQESNPIPQETSA